jgi:TolA-binding protein
MSNNEEPRQYSRVERIEHLQTRLDTATKQTPAADEPAIDGESTGSGDALKLSLQRVDDHISLQQQRVARLRKLGADAGRAAPRALPAAAAEVKADDDEAIRNGPLVPGQPFEVIVKDTDLTGRTVDVELRSLAGRLVDTLVAQAAQVEPGVYRVMVQTQRGDEPGRSTELSLMPGGEVLATYRDTVQTAPAAANRFAYVALASDAIVEVLNSTYTDVISDVRMGAPVNLQVTDYDADRSPELELLTITARSTRGDELIVTLTETEPHSGVFRGQFMTDDADAIPGDDRLQASYGGQIEIEYGDYLRQSAGDRDLQLTTVQIAGGSRGEIEAFARQFADADDELELWYLTGQCAYQVGRSLYMAGARARADAYLTESADYLQLVVDRAGEDELAARANYYLGNVLVLRGRQREAVARFSEVITRWPKSGFVAQARYKLAQCYESVGQFDRASDQYVLLAYHHPDDSLVPMAMLRMMNHFARNEDWADSIAIASRFVEKFESHDYAGEVALKAGQWLLADEKSDEAVAWYTKAEKIFATNDRAMAGLLYWHAATLIQMGQGRGDTEKVRELLNRVVYDYSRSEYAPLAQIALQQILDADN